MDQPLRILSCNDELYRFKGDSIDVKMPVWSPGYYQRLDLPIMLKISRSQMLPECHGGEKCRAMHGG
jgi:hypothetical protein